MKIIRLFVLCAFLSSTMLFSMTHEEAAEEVGDTIAMQLYKSVAEAIENNESFAYRSPALITQYLISTDVLSFQEIDYPAEMMQLLINAVGIETILAIKDQYKNIKEQEKNQKKEIERLVDTIMDEQNKLDVSIDVQIHNIHKFNPKTNNEKLHVLQNALSMNDYEITIPVTTKDDLKSLDKWKIRKSSKAKILNVLDIKQTTEKLALSLILNYPLEKTLNNFLTIYDKQLNNLFQELFKK